MLELFFWSIFLPYSVFVLIESFWNRRLTAEMNLKMGRIPALNSVSFRTDQEVPCSRDEKACRNHRICQHGTWMKENTMWRVRRTNTNVSTKSGTCRRTNVLSGRLQRDNQQKKTWPFLNEVYFWEKIIILEILQGVVTVYYRKETKSPEIVSTSISLCEL